MDSGEHSAGVFGLLVLASVWLVSAGCDGTQRGVEAPRAARSGSSAAVEHSEEATAEVEVEGATAEVEVEEATAEVEVEVAEVRVLEVVATAYNSVPEQTANEPDLTAWGDRLVPGQKAIAVSRDLLRLGLSHGVEVEISGLPGRWVVRDKLGPRWTERIDIYMGEDVAAARAWGKRSVTITWVPER